MKTNATAQAHLHPETIGAEAGQRHGQPGLNASISTDRIERIAKGAQDLHGPKGVGTRGIDRVDSVAARHDQAIGGAGRLAPHQGQPQQGCGQQASQACQTHSGARSGRIAAGLGAVGGTCMQLLQ